MSKFDNSRKLGVAAAALLGLALIGSSVYFVVRKPQKPEQQSVLLRQTSYRDPATGVEVRYPEQIAKVEDITEADRKEKILLRLTAQEGQAPMLATLRSESGLRVVANLTKASIIDILMSNS